MTVVLRQEESVVGGIRYNICSPAVRIPCITMRSSSLLNLGKQQEHSLKKILLGKFFFESRLWLPLLLLLPLLPYPDPDEDDKGPNKARVSFVVTVNKFRTWSKHFSLEVFRGEFLSLCNYFLIALGNVLGS